MIDIIQCVSARIIEAPCEPNPPPTHPVSGNNVVKTFFMHLSTSHEVHWDTPTVAALAVLIVVWAVRMQATWATWGNLTIDCGREMYVPAVLAESKTLYRDVWYLYGPAAPYFNSWLFRLFGIHLNVLYWAGSLSALGSAIFLFLSGMRLSSWLAGWTAGAVVLLQSFYPSVFSFPLPYSFASVYGCFAACIFLWLMIRAGRSKSLVWVFAAGTTAGIELLLKFEFGAMCFLALVLLIAARALQRPSRQRVARDLLAILPGLMACFTVIGWMISLGGLRFLINENLAAFPTSYFMRVYGKLWLEERGLALTPGAVGEAMLNGVILASIAQGLCLVASWRRQDHRMRWWRALLFFGAILYLAIVLGWREAIAFVFFPQAMALYVGLAAVAAAWYVLRQPAAERDGTLVLALFFSFFIAARVLLKTTPLGYSIYYDGPVVLSFLLLAQHIVTQVARSPRSVFIGKSFVCAGCLLAVVLGCVLNDPPKFDRVTLTTGRGSIKVSPGQAERYTAAIEFMKAQENLGESVLSIPEDASLYFLSGTHCPTRVCTFTPGILVPGKMSDEIIQEVERKRVRYLIWSNRVFPEYRALRFGVDFDREFGAYLMSHYRRIRPLTQSRPSLSDWSAFIWERIPDPASP
jgi:hypothetical protein